MRPLPNKSGRIRRFLVITLSTLFLAPVAYAALHLSPEDVERCVAKTGWSVARCEVELNR